MIILNSISKVVVNEYFKAVVKSIDVFTTLDDHVSIKKLSFELSELSFLSLSPS